MCKILSNVISEYDTFLFINKNPEIYKNIVLLNHIMFYTFLFEIILSTLYWLIKYNALYFH